MRSHSILGVLIEPRGAEADARHVGHLHRLLEGHRGAARPHHAALEHNFARLGLQLRRDDLGDPAPDLVAGRLHGHAVEIAARACRRGRGVRHLGRVRRSDLHPLRPHAEPVGGHLRHLLEQALAHLGAAMVHVDGTVLVDMHQCTRLVQMRQREGDPEFHRRDGDAALQNGIGAAFHAATRAWRAGRSTVASSRRVMAPRTKSSTSIP
jgi:hypothetical protein